MLQVHKVAAAATTDLNLAHSLELVRVEALVGHHSVVGSEPCLQILH
jgi:hypothetical protein